MTSPTRDELPQALRAAKRRALARYLFAAPRRAPGAVHRISAQPQHNVVGVGVGSKFTRNKTTGRPSVRLYVAQKLDRRLIPPRHLLPPEIGGVETDVVELGRLRAQVPAWRKRNRPARPGCSIGFALAAPQDGLLMAGTLGAIVTDGATRYVLSNNHVLANENQLAAGAPIYQPGLLDHGEVGADAIARLSRFSALSATKPNRIDCAIAEILAPELIGTALMPKVGKLANPQPIAVVEGMAVEKVGRGSGYSVGRVFDVSATLVLGYAMGEISFVDQILIRGTGAAFSEDGDSGALVVDVDSGRATGLLIGGRGDYSVANHLEDVLAELGVGLVC